MKTKSLVYIVFALFYFVNLQGQTNIGQDGLFYKIDAFGSAATGNNTPFWAVSNRYGKVPLEAGNGYLSPGIFYKQSLGKDFHWAAGVDLVVSAPRYRNVYIQQLYAEIGFQSLLLSIGSKEQYRSLWDRNLSSGDMVSSVNARPIPEIRLHIPEYTIVPLTKGRLQVRGDFTVGSSFDKDYLKHFANDKQLYVYNVLWHHKSIYFRIKDTRNAFPLSLEIGLQHGAQWGGTSTDPAIGKQPHTLKDFARIVMGKEGGEGASLMDAVNVLGNHFGSYDFRLGFSKEMYSVHAYYQHFFEDKSGMRFDNKTDGLWGLQIDLPQVSWLRKLVFEKLETRHQSGPLHWISFDRGKYSGFGGGADRYYNNEEYTTGLSHFNRSIGTPLLNSPEYNTDGKVGFKNTRVSNWHVGLEGELTSQLSYRALFTVLNGWGTPYQPYIGKRDGVSGLLEISYTHPALTGWHFTGSIAGDSGTYFDKGIGFALSVSKRGNLLELFP